jgi:hypothetical protein
MQRIFPPALVACISEGRAPYPGEVQGLAVKILREAFSGCRKDGARMAHQAANTALIGHTVAA